METISILGCGWLGEPLAERLVGDGYTVKGSTTTAEKLDRLAAKGVAPYLIRLDLEDPRLDPDFFDAEVLFLNIPPGRRGPGLGVLNVCSDAHPTRRAFYTRKAEELGMELPMFAEGAPVRFKQVSNERLKQALGYAFRYPDPLDPAP